MRRIAGLPCGRWTKWVVLAFWIAVVAAAEPVKHFEARSGHAVCAASWLGSLIQATVGAWLVRACGAGTSRGWRRRRHRGLGPLGSNFGGGAVGDRCRRVIADAAMAVLVVVVQEEPLAERSGVFDAAEALGELRAGLERLELGLAERVVVAHLRAAVVRPIRGRRAARPPGSRSSSCPGPRSAWTGSWPGGTAWRATASAMSALASPPDAEGATHQATTSRLKMSNTTSRSSCSPASGPCVW
jgi:hypothetical protein